MKIFVIGSVIVIGLFLIYKYIQISNIDKNSSLVSINKGVILDVRSNKEFQSGHINGAINIKMSDLLDGQYKKLDKKQTYYVYCSLGLRSIKVSAFLKEKGFEKVINSGPMSEIAKYINNEKSLKN